MTSRRPQFPQPAPVELDGDHWTTQAACQDAITEDFYVGTTDDKGWYTAGNAEHIRNLRRLCSGCPVRTQCLEAAIVEFDRFSFRGGMTPPERRRFARKETAS